MAYEIRPMVRAELDLAIDWAAQEGWNPGIADGDCFFATDPDGFLVGLRDGEPIASISVVAYGEAYGFLGFYIVKEGSRGQGYGLKIWQAGMARLGKRCIGLDGVVDQQANYRKSGFQLAHQNLRYAGQIESTESITGIASADLASAGDLAAYDTACVPVARPAFLQRWLAPSKRTTRVAMEDGNISGFGVIRQCREGHKIGPLFADDPGTAERLFLSLTAEAGGDTVFIDPPAPNSSAVALAERYGMTPMFETARMYSGLAPDLPLDRIFGITTFELG